MPTETGVFTRKEIEKFGYHITHETIADYLAGFFDLQLPVIDVGAGVGFYSKALTERGFQCVAVDGSSSKESIRVFPIESADLSQPCDLPAGQVLCLEVGEHIPPEFEDVFFGNLLQCARQRVVLSWGIIGQVGDGHVNCRDNYYVIEKMRQNGWCLDVEATDRIRQIDYGPWWWFYQTMMCFVQKEGDCGNG